MTIEEIESNFDHENEQDSRNYDYFTLSDDSEPEESEDIDRTDLLKLYLREASRSSMLTAQGEIEGAKRIERARIRLNRILSKSPVIAEYCIYLRNVFRQ